MKAAHRPDAIILACWPNDDPLLASLGIETSLVSLGDKTTLQRVVEKLVALGCLDIALIHGDQPQEATALLDDGTRWGCRITHHYARDGAQPLIDLNRLAPLPGETCWLASADTVIDLAVLPEQTGAICWQDAGALRWTGWAYLDNQMFRNIATSCGNKQQLTAMFMQPAIKIAQITPQPLSTEHVENTLTSLRALLKQNPGPEGITRRPRDTGIWIGTGSRIDPGAKLIAPAYIGDRVFVAAGATIGPNASIGNGCIIDVDAHISESIVLPATYIGRGLNLTRSLVNGNQYASEKWGVALAMRDPELIGTVSTSPDRRRQTPMSQRFLAILLWLICWPLKLLVPGTLSATPRSIGIPGTGPGGFRSIDVRFTQNVNMIEADQPQAWARHFIDSFHPGLLDVVAGRLALVGPQVRSAAEILSLPDHWRRHYQRAPAGLLNETQLFAPNTCDPVMSHAGDALAAEIHSISHTTSLIRHYLFRVVRDLSRKQCALALTGDQHET